MFNRSLIAFCLVVGLSAGTEAYANDAGTMEVNPGLWNWTHQTKLANQPFGESNTECLSEDKASFSLQDFADALGNSCRISNVAPQADGYVFSLNCTGFYTGQAQGSMTKFSDDEIRVSARGNVTLAGVTAPFEFDAKANRVGACQAQ